MLTKPLSQQRQLEPVTKYTSTFLASKTIQVTVVIEIHYRVIQWLEFSIVCAMKEGNQFCVSSPGIGSLFEPKFASQVRRVDSTTQ